MKVIAMTLRRAPERGVYIDKHLSGLKLDYAMVDCMDYRDYTEEEYARFYDAEAVRRNPYLFKGVIGCTLSHLKIYDKMAAENIPCALVLEDDASLPSNIRDILDRIEPELEPEEVIALSYHNHAPKDTLFSNSGRKKIAKGLELVYPVALDEIASTMGYVITLAAARKLAAINRPVRFSCDYWGTYYKKGGFSSFRCLYPVVVKPVSFRSTIDYPAGKTLISRLAARVRKYKVPLLYQLLQKRSNKLLEEKYSFRFTDDPPFLATVPEPAHTELYQ